MRERDRDREREKERERKRRKRERERERERERGGLGVVGARDCFRRYEKYVNHHCFCPSMYHCQ